MTTPHQSQSPATPKPTPRYPITHIIVLLILLAVGVTIALVAYFRSEPAPPNIVFILIDTLRADHLEAYGYDRQTAPNLAKLADRGVLFDRCIAPSSLTKTSMAAILCARNPSGTGVIQVDDVIPKHLTTLAEALRDGGYETIGINTNPWLIADQFGFEAGYDYYHTFPGGEEEPAAPFDAVRDMTLDQLRRRQTDRPLFLYLHLMDTHYPYAPSKPYFNEPPLSLPGLGTVTDQRLAKLYCIYTKPQDEAQRTQHQLDRPDVRRRVIDLYNAEIRQLDHAIGQFIDQMKSMGYDRNTIYVITSDHGEEFREHGRTLHGWNLYPEVLHVPLIFHAPGLLPPRTRIGAQVRGIDIAPTIVDIAGLQAPGTFEGRSLWPMDDALIRRPPAVAALGPNTRILDRHYVAVVTPEHLYIREKTTGQIEFYNLRTDPAAQSDLGPDHESVNLYVEIEQADERTTPTEKAELDEDLINRLKSAGYF